MRHPPRRLLLGRVIASSAFSSCSSFSLVLLRTTARITPTRGFGKPPPPDIPDAALAISDAELDLGQVWETSAHDHLVHITNVSDRPVTITRFETTGNCLGVVPPGDVRLEAHEGKELHFKLSLTSRSRPAKGPDGEPFLVRFRALYSTDDDIRAAAEWQLRAQIRPALRPDPLALRFGAKSDGQLEAGQVIRIEAHDNVAAIECETPADWTVEIMKDRAGSGAGTFVATVRRKPEGKFGQVDEVIRLCPIDQEGKKLPVKEVKLAGEVVRDVVASPREIHHGRVPCGTTAEETIRLVSLTNRPFRVKSAGSRSADLTVTRMLEDEGGLLYSLRTHFTGLGEREVVADFTIEDGDGKVFDVSVPIRYCGLQGP